MHNEPALQPAREKPPPNSTTGHPTTTTTTLLVNGHGTAAAATPGTPENPSRTPLHEAASSGDEAKVEALLAAGADRNAKESVHGNNPLHEAAWKGYSRCVKLLCALPKTAGKGDPKAIAAKGGGGGGLSLDLLKDAAKIKHALQDTKGALHSALLGTRNFGGFSALHLAAQNGHNQSCREILLAGADPDVQNNYGDTPLHTACRYGHAGAIRILLSAKCDFERINLNGDTALHIACAMGRRKLTRILLEAGCRQDTKNAQDETARDIAQRKNLVEIINILNTPVELSPRRSRERSSSSSQHHQSKAADHHRKPTDPGRRSRSKDEPDTGGAGGRKSGRRSNSNEGAATAAAACEVDPRHWSPYGCHYFPDPRNFPSPKLETLPKEPLGNGEQYFLDLAGNIRKGPVGVGNTCYCAPFFKHLEQRMNRNRRSIRKYVHRATEKLDSRMAALALRTDDQIEELTKSMIANRVQCENKRLHLEQWLRRGLAERSSTTTNTAAGAATPGHSNSKTKKDEANTNTLTRCRSLELLDDGPHEPLDDQLLFKCSSTPTARQPLFSRSIDFLDATATVLDAGEAEVDGESEGRVGQQHRQQLESHLRMLQYAATSLAPAGGHHSDAFESSTNSNVKNHSESGATPPIAGGAARRGRSSSVSRCSGRDSYSYSSDTNKDNDREKPERARGPTTARNGSSSSEKAKVTERLEELLSKTKKILELEKLTKGGVGLVPPARPGSGSGSGSNGAHAHGSPDNRYILALDKLRDIHHYEPAGTGGTVAAAVATAATATGASTGYDIAQEMERITKSLLPAAPVSPEIAKDITTRKERPTSVYASYGHTHRRASPLSSTMSPGSSLLGGQLGDSARGSHLASTHFTSGMEGEEREDQEEEEDDEEEGQYPGVAGGGGGGVGTTMMNGFYSNSCFDDMLPSSSNTTVKSATPRHRAPSRDSEDEEEEDGEGDARAGQEETGSDLSDRCDLSAMANLAELKELKSRILNGTNWRSQVLQKSVQELLRGAEGQQEEEGSSSQPMAPCPNDSNGDDDDDPATETNRVKYIISKLQQSCSVEGEGTAAATTATALGTMGGSVRGVAPPLAQCEDFSDSSEDEEEEEDERQAEFEEDEHEECVDGPLPGQGSAPRTVPEQAEQGIATARTLIRMYEQTTAKHHPPKDAYFHELPVRKHLPPPDLSSMRPDEPQVPRAVHQTARSRNPLPSSYLLSDGAGGAELFNGMHQEQDHHHQHHLHHHQQSASVLSYSMPSEAGFLPPVGLPAYPAHHHPHHYQLPSDGSLPAEKLLSARKLLNPSTASLASTGTPSPEFPHYHHHHHNPQQQQQQQQQQQAQPQSAAVNHVIGGHSHAMMTLMAAGRKSADNLSNDDSGYVSGKVSEIHIPSGGASPLLAASTGNVLIIPPPASSSSSPKPHPFLPPAYHGHHGHHQHHNHPLMGGLQHHHRNGGPTVTSIVPPPLGTAGALLHHPTAGQTTAQLHAAVEQKQQSLYKLGASSLV